MSLTMRRGRGCGGDAAATIGEFLLFVSARAFFQRKLSTAGNVVV
jgi:hypothetical protein